MITGDSKVMSLNSIVDDVNFSRDYVKWDRTRSEMGQCHTNDRLEKINLKTISTDFTHCHSYLEKPVYFSFHRRRVEILQKQISFANICHVLANFWLFISRILWMKSIHQNYWECVDKISFQTFRNSWIREAEVAKMII